MIERGGFYGGVPAVDVVGGVGFGDAQRLRFLQRFVEGEAGSISLRITFVVEFRIPWKPCR